MVAGLMVKKSDDQSFMSFNDTLFVFIYREVVKMCILREGGYTCTCMYIYVFFIRVFEK